MHLTSFLFVLRYILGTTKDRQHQGFCLPLSLHPTPRLLVLVLAHDYKGQRVSSAAWGPTQREERRLLSLLYICIIPATVMPPFSLVSSQE